MPLGLQSYSREEAAALNRAKPFDLHLHRQAQRPLSPRRLRDEILDLVEPLLARHRAAVEVLGP